MWVFAFEGGLQWHTPSGLWPVYAAGALAGCAIALAVLATAIGANREAPLRRLRRRALLVAAPSAVLALGLYVYADSRYQRCLDDGHHPWWTDHYEIGKGVCDRAVVGKVLVEPPYRP